MAVVVGRRSAAFDADGDVTAIDVARYTFCAKAWHLEHVLGQKPTKAAVARRKAGTKAHVVHGRELRTVRTVVAGLLAASLLLLAWAIGLLIVGQHAARR